MPKISLPLVGQTYKLPQCRVSAQTCINWYPQVTETANGEYVSALIPTAGLKPYLTVGTGAIRGMQVLTNGDMIVIAGTEAWYLPNSGSPIDLGFVSGTDLVSITDNGLVAIIVNGIAINQVDMTTHVMSNVDPAGFPVATFVAFIDGRFVFNAPNTGKFYWSDLYSTNINALSFATAESSPDNLRALISLSNNLWLIGDTSTEVYYSSGDQNAPYYRVSGAIIGIGIAAPRSVSRFGTSLMWLAKSEFGQGYVVQTNGYSPQRISTQAIDDAIASYSRIDDAVGYAYQFNGHSFYVLTFPSGNATWVYDQSTQMWHQWAYWSAGAFQRHLGICHALWKGQHLIAGYSTNQIYQVDQTCPTDNGTDIVRERAMPVVSNQGNFNTFNALEIVTQPHWAGDTNVSTIELSWSDDGGVTFKTPRLQNLPPNGNLKKQRVIYRRLGTARERVFRIRVYSNSVCAVLAARLDAVGNAA